MRGLFWLLAIFALAVGITLAGKGLDGYVLIVLHPWRVELSLNLMLALILTGCAAAYGVTRITVHMLRLPQEVREFHQRRDREKARQGLVAALRAYFEGRYAKAERAATQAMALGAEPGLAAVVAARSAHELRRFDRRDALLEQAREAPEEDRAMALVTEAEFLIDQRRHDEALAVLRRVRQSGGSSHTAALRLELKAQQLAKNWDGVLELLDQLDKRDAFERTLAEQVRRAAHVENVKRKALEGRGLNDYWQRLPATLRRDTKVAAAGAQAFVAMGGCDTAQQILADSLEAQWDTDLVALYGECTGKDLTAQIQRAEGWVRKQPGDAVLLLVLGRLCSKAELWGKAQSYLEASLSLEPTHTAHRLLAELHERAGRAEAAQNHYRGSLALALEQLKEASGGRRRAGL